MIIIWMIKICDASIYKPLELIFRSCLENGKFPTEWKKANVVPAHKKGDGHVCFFFEWAKISIFNILYILYKIVGDRNFGSIIYF